MAARDAMDGTEREAILNEGTRDEAMFVGKILISTTGKCYTNLLGQKRRRRTRTLQAAVGRGRSRASEQGCCIYHG